MSSTTSKPWHVVRDSRIHGKGVFAARKIPAGTQIFEYIGEIISSEEADRRHPADPDDPFHTFFFALGNDTVIDGGVGGNDAKWINHSCEPNCETEETDDHRVFIVALRDIDRGEELYYDYSLVLDERLTPKVKAQYACACGTRSCRGTMLALKRKPATRQAGSTVQSAGPEDTVSADADGTSTIDDANNNTDTDGINKAEHVDDIYETRDAFPDAPPSQPEPSAIDEPNEPAAQAPDNNIEAQSEDTADNAGLTESGPEQATEADTSEATDIKDEAAPLPAKKKRGRPANAKTAAAADSKPATKKSAAKKSADKTVTKVAATKAASEDAPVSKKASARKTVDAPSTKKTAAKKASGAAATKKIATKKASEPPATRKSAAKKAAAKSAKPETRTPAKKAAAKSAAPKKAGTKTVGVKKAAATKVSVKKAAPTKATAKKATAKKASAKKAAAKKVAATSATAKKAGAKKAPATKVSAKKATAKKVAMKKSAAKKRA